MMTTTEANANALLPVRFRRDAAELAAANPERGTMRTKLPKGYYLDGLAAVFQPEVALPGVLRVEPGFVGAEVVLLQPGSKAVEVLELVKRFPGIKCLHIIESCEKTLDELRAELEREPGRGAWPELAGYVTDIRHLPEELAERCDLVVAINVVDPKADTLFRQDAARQISRVLKIGGLFYSGGVTVRWTDRVIPLSLVPVPLRAKVLKGAGYSEALPRPVVFLKTLPDVPAVVAEEGNLRRWWKKGLALVGPGRAEAEVAPVAAPVVPRVEDGRGEPNAAPWDFLITKPTIRRPAMDWKPKDGDRFGTLTLGALLQFNRDSGMYVFRVRECPEVVLKLMKPFEGDIPDNPLEWDSLRKSKTLKRENQALKLLKGLGFIPQRVAHGYEPITGWYAIVVEYEPSGSFSSFMDRHANRLHRRHETAADVDSALEPVRMLLNALAIVHDKGVVHQDLKPGHVFLRPASPEAVLIDWGLARKIDEPLSEERRSGSWIHAPPERWNLDHVTTAATHQDLYAVGVMLLQVATGTNFDERPRFLIDHFLKHGCMPSAAELEGLLRPHWKWAAPVIARAISSRKDVPGYADHRYTSAREMADEIERRRGER